MQSQNEESEAVSAGPRENAVFTLVELAERSGVSARTIRYYITQGLLPGPLQRGRNAHYGPEHLERLHAIQRLKREGKTLAEIRRRLSGGVETPAPPFAPPPELWYTYRCGDEVIVQVRATASPWRLHRIRRLIQEIAALEGDPGTPVESRGGPDNEC